ncbi:Heterokaryon incompatibility protein 6, OR allele [Colletotrichum tanaceti]|uniref:Heterokaryon incompatibility protein 6, OR allele n=1 Tax=Colletotrichum tanaceti TaxID=1306861 RepID=A0A4U6X474_9PEZI|nr:Heterokaryon incompatibility protein 6, OR allele [Colletotrichum tanaceti]TKW49723.1 Heterokaryon incompatibility protein 6, OR allele [Colletotrichum tanaceti]
MNPTSEARGVSYRALDHTTDAFRLLYIRPPELEPSSSAHNDLVTTELRYHRLSDAPPFTALSYCWGQAATRSPIVIDGAVQRCGLNGELALRHLRRAEGVHVWIDQLCINQNDNAEKGRQVRMMRRIYSAAARVAVWTGLPADDSDLLLPHLRAMSALIRQLRYADVVRAHADIAFLRRVSRAFRAFRAFCERPYWTRLWIIQEFAVGAEIDVLCGRASVEYAELRGFLVFLNRAYDHHPAIQAEGGLPLTMTLLEMLRGFKTPANSFLEGVLTRRRRYQLRHGGAPVTAAAPTTTTTTQATPQVLEGVERAMAGDSESLFAVLVTTLVLEVDYNHTQATDPRDRVFAVMHFADDVDEFEGLPDYSLGRDEVYRAVARRILIQGNIDLLSYCQFVIPREASPPATLATWAPDWQAGIKRPNVGNPWLSKFDASASSLALARRQLVRAPDEETVQLRGVLVDAVAEIGGGSAWDPNWVEELDRGAALAFVDEVGRLCAKSPRFGDRVRERRDLWDVMRICIADRYHYREPERQAELLEGFAQAELWLRRDVGEAGSSGAEMGSQMEDSLGWRQPWYVTAMKNLHGRRPFLSGSGYVGLAPRHVLPGDKIVVFLGGKTPYIVRDTGVAGYCELVGEAYVHGIMFGEAMTDDCEVREFLLR